jgi:hypothetical protein
MIYFSEKTKSFDIKLMKIDNFITFPDFLIILPMMYCSAVVNLLLATLVVANLK